MYRNFTKHVVVANSVSFPTCGEARVSSRDELLFNHDGIDVVSTIWGEVEGLPSPEEGVFLIVSLPVLQALPGRKDLVRPDTGPASVVRDDEGKIIGVKRFTR